MNEQLQEFERIAHQCHNSGFTSINVASQRRSDAIWAAYMEPRRLRAELDKALAALNAVEWACGLPHGEYCPDCGIGREVGEHMPDCRIGTVLARTKEES